MNKVNFDLIKKGPHHNNLSGEDLENYLKLQKKYMLKDFEEEAARISKELSDGKILVIGFSVFEMFELLKSVNPKLSVYGLSVNPELVKAVNNRYPGSSIMLWSDLEIPFEDNSFSHILTMWELHHWKEPEVIIANLYKKLRQGATLEIIDLYKSIAYEALTKFDIPLELVKRMKNHLTYTFALEDVETMLSKIFRKKNYEVIVNDNFFRIVIKK